MRALQLYYLIKPAIPQSVRMSVRRVRALQQRRKFAGSWPVNPTAGTVPMGWPGWPNGKSFAFVLTHDVEGSKGIERCHQLAALEMNNGFRSSFNFVPEGEYVPPEDLRAFLMAEGFEVGVHDLHHDGSLYRSSDAFRRAAPHINAYLRRWGAVGFRSGFMFHNLDWIKQLDVLYDASTFDTDPFEPQPDGMQTIFPFWVTRGDGSGYAELPYTLPQDSTLFLMLRETTNAIWKRKLDWVASRGGMALVNVHPDYICFDGRCTRTEFSAELYRDFLGYARTKYASDAWFALPRDIGAYVREHRHALALT
jgi:hypothetical protein